jgi:alkanesulfonate monooxygenase SsuD/methylene tetrahydromethanopterin reductase-like flavin-dependent oxidoreductase (luciferase family)
LGPRVDILFDPFGARWPDLRNAAMAAVDAGFRGIWTYDHVHGHVYDAPDVLECWTILSALAAVAPDVALGPLVLNVANRPAGVLAVMAATLQHVSGGRLVLGLGAGARPGTPYAREQQAIGLPVYADAERRTHVERAVEDLRRLWQTDGFLSPDPAPPIVIAAFAPKMAELAGRVGDGINTRAKLPQLSDVVAIARAAHHDAGRDPGGFLVTVFTEFDDRWLDPSSPGRARLTDLGAHRLILSVRSPYPRDRITAAARLLAE